jgi:antitoxin PrlF
MQNSSTSAKLRYMKATVTITSRGVVTLPAKLRRALGLKADDQLIAETTPEGLLLRPAVTLPVELYTSEREREFDEAEAELAGVLAVDQRPTAPAARLRKPRRR